MAVGIDYSLFYLRREREERSLGNPQRASLLPATMKLLGERNWYMPRWLGWVPRLTPQPAASRTPQPPLIAAITSSREPAESGVSSSAGSPST